MDAGAAIDLLAGILAPPRCILCARPCGWRGRVCTGCDRRLRAADRGSAQLAGVGWVDWAAPYEGVARELVAALKFGARTGVADRAARAIAAAASADLRAFAVVAVPAAPARRRRRGYDPAELIARRLAGQLELPLRPALTRADGPRQVGRRRAERLATPPSVRAHGPSPARALLVDDVLTTGATLRACAGALRRAGATTVRAAVFARALGAWSKTPRAPLARGPRVRSMGGPGSRTEGEADANRGQGP